MKKTATRGPAHTDRRRVPPTPARYGRAHSPGVEGLLNLQATSGNRAVTALLADLRTVQRGAQTAGWSKADTSGPVGGWNVKARDVGTIRRVPLEGLSLGKQDFAPGERDKTIETAAGRAVVLVSNNLNPDNAVDILLHLHGWGFRKTDPHAGWRQHKEWGTVRDVDQDRIEAQLEAAANNQMIGILPQGVGKSDFGGLPDGDYVSEVLKKLVAAKELRKQPASGALQQGRIVLSGHSGGGDSIAFMLGKPIGRQAAEIILFEAIHAGGLGMVVKWATDHLEKVRQVLLSPGVSPSKRAAAIGACPRLRAYCSTHTPGDPGSGRYVTTYTKLKDVLDAWFNDHGADLGADKDAVQSRFEVKFLTGASHETSVRGLGDDPAAGPLADAVGALDRPTGSPSKLLESGTADWKPGRSTPTTTTTVPKGTAPVTPASKPPTPAMAAPAVGHAQASAGADAFSLLAGALVTIGMRDRTAVTDVLFALAHPEMSGARIPKSRPDLSTDWLELRRRYTTPALARAASADTSTTGASARATGTASPVAVAPPADPVQAPASPARVPAPVASGKAAPTSAAGSMAKEQREAAIAAAIKQATTAGGKSDRADLEATVVANGKTLEEWFGGLVPDAKFLGSSIVASGGSVAGVHQELYDRLQMAEQTLLKLHPGRTAAQIGADLGLREVSGVRPPKKATGGKLPSYHCFGLAVDINHPTNPFVGNEKPTLKKNASDEEKAKYQEYLQNRSPRVIERAMLLLHQEKFNVEDVTVPKGPGTTTGRLWEIHHRASETLAEYLRLADDLDGKRLAGLVDAMHKAGTDDRPFEWWRQRVADDRKFIKNWDFEHHSSPQTGGYMDLPKDLVEALVGAGLLWGGSYSGAKDIMHFDWRGGTIKKRPKPAGTD